MAISSSWLLRIRTEKKDSGDNMENRTLFQLSADMAAIEEALWENGGELTEDLAIALAETEQSIAVKVDGYNSLIRKFSSQADVIDAEIKRLTALKKTCQNAEKRLKEHVCETMGAYGIDKLEGQYCKITRVRTSRVEVDEERVKHQYQGLVDDLEDKMPIYLNLELKVSKTGIKEYEKSTGILPAGAEIVDNYSLRIK